MKKVDEGLINHEELLKLLQAWTKWYRLFFFFLSRVCLRKISGPHRIYRMKAPDVKQTLQRQQKHSTSFFGGKTSQLMLMKLFETFEKMQRMCNASPGRISNLKPRPGTVHSSRSMKPCQMVLSVLKMRVHGVFTVRVY